MNNLGLEESGTMSSIILYLAVQINRMNL